MDTLLNWIVQGSVVAALASAMLAVSRLAGAAWRFRVWAAALVVVLLLPAIPLLEAAKASQQIAPAVTSDVLYAPVLPQALISTAGSVAAALWTVWVLAHGSRGVAALVAVRKIRKSCVMFPAKREERLAHWRIVSRSGRRTRLVISDRISDAAVLGISSPVIAIAPDLLGRLEDDELDRVVIHEWAHVQRRDDRTNVVQAIIGILAGCHPAVWWINRQLVFEREAACDEIVVRTTGLPRAYATCLAKLASLRVERLTAPVPGAFTESRVGARIRRVLSLDAKPPGRSGVAAALVLGLLPLTGIGVASLPIVSLAIVNPERPGADAPSEVGSTARSPTVGHTGSRNIRARSVARAKPSPLPERRPLRRPASTPIVSSRVSAGDRAPISRFQDGLPSLPEEPSVPLKVAAPILTTGALPPDSIRMPTVAAVSSRVAKPASPWTAAADAGAAVGRGSQKAAVSTAGFFTRLGKKIAGAF